MFWRGHDHEFDRERFEEYLRGAIMAITEGFMADISKLQADIDAQKPLIDGLVVKVAAQGQKITDLEAQISANPGPDPQAPIDALAATVEANNATLATNQ
jgi:hypothetical protein